MMKMSNKTRLPNAGSEAVGENPQLARVRQHFEKRNKKFNQERDNLEVSYKKSQSKSNSSFDGINQSRSYK